MNSKSIVWFMLLCVVCSTEAQILKNLAKKAEKAAERTLLNRAERESEKATDQALDSIWGTGDGAVRSPTGEKGKEGGTTDYNTAKGINTELKRSFYTHDVVIHTVNENNETGTHFFDAEELAMRGTSSTTDKPIYIDSEAYQYGYNEHEGRWEKTGLMRSDAMSFMMPMLSIGMVKLPPDPMLEATDRFKEQGLLLNTFLIVEWAFIYSPDDFRVDGYSERTVPCEDGGDCVAFDFEDKEYKGTYVTFDNQGRLSRIYAKVNNEFSREEGSFEFDYSTPVSVSIPQAVEVKMPFQDFFSGGLNVQD